MREPRGAVSRRDFVKSAGALVVTFALPPAFTRAAARKRPRVVAPSPEQLDSWIAIGADDRVTVFCGKVELGTGVSTALRQIVAEELAVPFDRIDWVQADTQRTPDQGATTGSRTIKTAGPALRQASATARQALVELAAERLGVPADRLVADGGSVAVEAETSRRVSYGALIGGRRFERRVDANARLKPVDRYTIVGRPIKRADIPGKVTGRHVYVHDVTVPGMLHGRVVRPPAPTATLASIDESSVRSLPGVVAVVRRESFLGVVAEREEQAIRAAAALRATWTTPNALPRQADLPAALRAAPATVRELVTQGGLEGAMGSGAAVHRATYFWPYQMHASIGPSCGVADVRDGEATIWSATQGAHQLVGPLAHLLGIPADRIRVIWTEGSGCYGHNGADDAAADAALMSQVVRRPVRVQWSRADEHIWEPKGPAMLHEMAAALSSDGRIIAWDAAVWTGSHVARPGGQSAATLLAGRLLGQPAPTANAGGGDRNARTTYRFPAERVVGHFLHASPLRTSALRGLGSPANTFANESFIDELARRASVDPVALRLQHLDDPRAIAVVEGAARLAKWTPPTGLAVSGAVASGRGFAYARYASTEAYVAGVVDVEVRRDTGKIRVRRVFIVHDCGLIINPDGLRNQIEGNVVQAISRTIEEEVKFDTRQVTSRDWASYPILRFADAPDAIDIELIDRPKEPSLGAGEPAMSVIPAAIANAVADATGARIRTIPLTPARVKAALTG